MDQNPEQFKSLRTLLALKRHEAPPPRFFDQLPNRVMREIATEKPEKLSAWECLLDRLFTLRWFQASATGAMALGVGTLLMLAVMQPPADPGSSANATPVPPIEFRAQDGTFYAISNFVPPRVDEVRPTLGN